MCFLHVDDWRADQHRWVHNGVASLPRKEPRVKKSYYLLDTPDGPSKAFQRHTYQLPNNKNITVIHYVGDESVASHFPHRNAKHSTTPFIHSCPSYLKKWEEKCQVNKANVVYKKEVAQTSCQPEHVPVCTPRNMQQLRSIRHRRLNQQRIFNDELYNLHELAYDIPGFIQKIVTFPDLTCVCGLPEMLEEADKVLILDEGQQLLSYDTTFQLHVGDFYVSPLLFRHTLFTEKPCIPAMFLIHERKFSETHQVLFQEAVQHIPSIRRAKSCLVTKKEPSLKMWQETSSSW